MTSLPLRSVVLGVALLSGYGGPLQGGLSEEDGYSESGFTVREVAEEGFEYHLTDQQMFGNLRTGVYVTDFDGNGWPGLLAVGGDEPTLFENTGGSFRPSGALTP